MPISCHFQDCESASGHEFTCKQRYSKYPAFNFTVYTFIRALKSTSSAAFLQTALWVAAAVLGKVQFVNITRITWRAQASRTMQRGSYVALVDGSKVHGSYVTAYTTDFKLATLSYKSRMTGQPDYLAAELRSYQPQLCLHWLSWELLTVPHCKTMLARCRFSVAAPRDWNSLPLGLKTNCDSLRGFKTGLKSIFILPGL